MHSRLHSCPRLPLASSGGTAPREGAAPCNRSTLHATLLGPPPLAREYAPIWQVVLPVLHLGVGTWGSGELSKTPLKGKLVHGPTGRAGGSWRNKKQQVCLAFVVETRRQGGKETGAWV